MQPLDHMEEDDELEVEPIEAYCVHCRQHVEMANPTPVWTRRGAPGTRGECPICANTIFRMGRTDAHRGLERPDLGQMLGTPRQARKGKGRASATRYAAYINYSPADTEFAARLAEDLAKVGIPTWYAPDSGHEKQHWASGVHPALTECSHMVVVLTDSALADEEVIQGWDYFRGQRKPVVVAQVTPCEVPDDLRTRPRFDFGGDYKTAFREMMQALSV
jgi:hypothetical protein